LTYVKVVIPRFRSILMLSESNVDDESNLMRLVSNRLHVNLPPTRQRRLFHRELLYEFNTLASAIGDLRMALFVLSGKVRLSALIFTPGMGSEKT
jgi:hypothetical protein